MNKWLEEHLVCPRDYNNLTLKTDVLVCPLAHTYPYIDGIPIMLLKEVKPTHGVCSETLKQLNCSKALHQFDKTSRQDMVDPFVQQMIAGTGGMMYRKRINKLTSYPIPELPLSRGCGQYLLDIGCNWGRWSIAAARKGFIPVGIDPSLDAIRAAYRVAKQIGIEANYIVADARYLPFAQNSFDMVFAYSVLQHFSKDDIKLTLAGIARILKNTGISLIQMPNIFGLRNLYNQLRKGFKKPTSFEVRYWRLSDLKNIFSNFIGPTSLFVDGYFSLNAQIGEIGFLPLRYKIVVFCSEILRRISENRCWMTYFADSLYVKSIKK